MSQGIPRVLIVDDEPALLEGIQRNLGRKFQFTTASNGVEALRVISDTDKPFEAVMSDFRMPEMDGIELLKKVKETTPDTVRVLLTGQWDTSVAVAAVNEGSVFRFLTKPCPMNTVAQTLQAAVELHRLVTAERVLLEQTLRGSIHALVRILSLSNPEAFGRANRVKRLVVEAATALKLSDTWALEVAAMLSQLGAVILPEDTVSRLYRGETLSTEDRAMVEKMPGVALELVADIPRLEPVREVLKWHTKNFDGTGSPAAERKGKELPSGARLLRVALDYDTAESTGASPLEVVTLLRGRTGQYDPDMVSAVAAASGVSEVPDMRIRELTLGQLRAGMMLIADVRSKTGMLLVARGHIVTFEMMERLRNVGARQGVQEPIRARVS